MALGPLILTPKKKQNVFSVHLGHTFLRNTLLSEQFLPLSQTSNLNPYYNN